LGGIHGFRRADRGRRIVQHRLGYAEEQQRDAVAGGKQHGEPGRKAVLRLGMVRPELDVAPLGQRDADDEDQAEGHRQHVEPAENSVANPAAKRDCGSAWSGPSLLFPDVVSAMPTMKTKKKATASM